MIAGHCASDEQWSNGKGGGCGSTEQRARKQDSVKIGLTIVTPQACFLGFPSERCRTVSITISFSSNWVTHGHIKD